MRLACNISRNCGLPDGYQKATDFGHYVKRDKEVEEKRAYSRLSTDRFFPGLAACLDVIGVKGVKDRKVLFEAFADLSLDDGRV
jgi:hypothetical protein